MIIVVISFAGCSSDETPDEPSTRQPGETTDAVSFWNRQINSTVVGVGFLFPGDAAVHQAIAHTAIYDAVVAIEGGYEPYADPIEASSSASTDAAVAAAAHDALVAMFPEQTDRLDETYQSFLSEIPGGDAKEAGVGVGEAAAANLLERRKEDGRDYPPDFQGTDRAPGTFRPTQPDAPLGSGLGRVDPFAMETSSDFRPKGPPRLTSRRYAGDLREVALLGEVGNSARSKEQTAIARFWTDHPVAQFNRSLRLLAGQLDMPTLEQARIFAATSVAGADALIGCFETKYHYLFWRPIHAIRRAGEDGNPRTAPDKTWSPLIPTPNHPDYPSAHACYSTAVATVIDSLVEETFDLTITSRITGRAQTYASIDELLDEIDDARVWGGIHFRSATRDGRFIGESVAKLVVENFFLPSD